MSIVAQGLCKAFGPRPAVERVSFAIAPGEIVGLLGPNGSGKSTLLRMLATFLTPTSGGASVAGFDCLSQPEEVRRSLGYLPEALPDLPDVRVSEFLDYRARLKQVPPRARKSEIERCLEACQLVGVRRRLIGRLSQGFRRRVGLADALLGNPRVLLLDEPTVGLDPNQVRETRDLLRAQAAHSTILLSTHLLAEAQAVCQRALVLMNGRLLSDLSLDRLGGNSRFEITLRARAEDCVDSLRQLPGIAAVDTAAVHPDVCVLRIDGTDSDSRERVVRECVARGWGVRGLQDPGGTLEEHFARITLTSRQEAA